MQYHLSHHTRDVTARALISSYPSYCIWQQLHLHIGEYINVCINIRQVRFEDLLASTCRFVIVVIQFQTRYNVTRRLKCCTNSIKCVVDVNVLMMLNLLEFVTYC